MKNKSFQAPLKKSFPFGLKAVLNREKEKFSFVSAKRDSDFGLRWIRGEQMDVWNVILELWHCDLMAYDLFLAT